MSAPPFALLPFTAAVMVHCANVPKMWGSPQYTGAGWMLLKSGTTGAD
jgi:hypothetical protein